MAVSKLEAVVSLCKRRGFVFPSAEIYGGLNGVYDLGPLGVALKQNIRAAWTASMRANPSVSVVFMEGSLLGSEAMWQASGHIANFHDPLVDCTKCKCRFRADDISLDQACPNCAAVGSWTEVREFQLMFKTSVGAVSAGGVSAYLRPETAQSIFVNMKQVMHACRLKLPFGIAQIGKAFRNEITPRQFLFRMREFEQMEIEWFCYPEDAERAFGLLLEARRAFYASLGFSPDRIKIRPHAAAELAHYSRGTSDIEYEFPFGWREVEGVANRGDFDIRQHAECSKKDLGIYDELRHRTIYPHVIEASVGVDRIMLALLCEAYEEEVLPGEDVRTVLRLHPSLAPISVAIMPLTKHQQEGAYRLFQQVYASGIAVQWDASGSIGKRYRRQDEIGTPWCITYDFDTEAKGSVTVRHRDSMEQERIAIDSVIEYVRSRIGFVVSADLGGLRSPESLLTATLNEQ